MLSRNVIFRNLRKFSTASVLRSSYSAASRKTLADIRNLYLEKKPIAVVTAWDYITGQITDKCEIDIALVGDSLAMVALGYDDTNEIELEELIYHAKAVSRGNKKSFLVADMPFGSFEASDSQAIQTAVRFVKNGRVQAVKIEGGIEAADKIAKIVKLGIPVMGHVGLTPQKHNSFGGYKLQGNSVERACEILDDCVALQKAGVFAIVLECIPNKLAETITGALNIPTIGIGAGPATSGQVLVMADMLGMGEGRPAKFVKKYMGFFEEATKSVDRYKMEVQKRSFPDADVHGYKMKSEVLQAVRKYAEEKKEQKL